jgi:hypothetical protein
MKKFNKKLGTSKKEQGIITLKAPRFKKWANGTLKCHCLFRGKSLWEECYPHIYQKEQQALMDTFIKTMNEENKKKEVKDGKHGKQSKTTKKSV